MNFTVLTPEGTTNHGDPNLICTPSRWSDYMVFFITNYFIHAATLPARPGETTRETIFAVLNALFIPGYGVTRALRRLILRPAMIRCNHLGQAAAAGALCMVVSDENYKNSVDQKNWKTKSHIWIDNIFSRDLSDAQCPRTRKIHGRCVLPKGYNIYVVPLGSPLKQYTRKAASRWLREAHHTEPGLGNARNTIPVPVNKVSQDVQYTISDVSKLLLSISFSKGADLPQLSTHADFAPSCEYSIVKALFSLVQVISGILTLYHGRGDQLRRYGYGAFSLSVVPYVFMSIMNIIASMICPGYPTMYLVHTPDLDQAEVDGGSFDGIVAELDVTDNVREAKKPSLAWHHGHQGELIIGYIISILVPISIVGGLSGFQTGESTASQRSWLITWLVLGSVSSIFSMISDKLNRAVGSWLFLIFMMPFWIPAIGGMVVVGNELREYGSCIKIDI